jgi:hypothetical protein
VIAGHVGQIEKEKKNEAAYVFAIGIETKYQLRVQMS